MSAATYTLFDKLNLQALKVQPKRMNASGKGAMVLLDYTEGARVGKFASPNSGMRQMWNIRPASMDGTIKDGDKFNLEVEIGPEHEAFAKKANAFDDYVLNSAFANKKEWFGDKNAAKIDSVAALNMTYNKLIIEGKQNRSGGKYNDSIRFKIEGSWAKYVSEVTYREDDPDKKGMPKDCSWTPRLVNALDPNTEVKENETQFFLYMSKDPTTGIDNYSDRVPVVDAAKHHVKDKDGNNLWRYVGPQDCRQNSRLTIVFAANRVWISDVRFGVVLTAKKVYIKPAPPKVTQSLEGVRVTSSVDVFLATQAVLNTQQVDDFEDLDEEDDEYVGGAGAAPVAIPKADVSKDAKQDISFEVGEKRTESTASNVEQATEASPKKRKVTKSAKPTEIVDPL